jgi:hypothetical protein
MKLDHLLGRDTRVLMQIVDVLRDHAGRLPHADEFGDGGMTRIRLRPDPAILVAEAPAPCFPPRGFGRHELLEVDGLHARPDAARTAEIRDARFGADACACEDHHATAGVQEAGQSSDVSFTGRGQVWGRHTNYAPRLARSGRV